MNRIVVLTLLALLLTGCRITTAVVGQGTITSQSGNFSCTTGNAGACAFDYATAGSEVFVASPAPGWTFSQWTNCNYVSILSCETSFNQGLASGSGTWAVTATFKPISSPVQAATYTYNALGQRVTKKIGSMTTLFQYDLEGNLIAELNGSGQLLRQHIYINQEPIAQLTRKSDGTLDVQYVHADHLGTPTLLTNQSGKVVADIEAMPFGETFVEYAEVEYNKRFPGQYKDTETGLHYNYFRDYDPSTGRYVQSDPIGLGDGLNTYVYVGGNPVIFIDSDGLFGQSVQGPSSGGHGSPGGMPSQGDAMSGPNGNMSGGPNPSGQDWKCSGAACIFTPFPPIVKRCIAHDQCYQNNGCNQSSWGSNALGGTKSCNQCNSDFFD